ncbi:MULTISPECIES: bifunctional tetrahydrofolate synthase/dihydrofolate synthase [unclassified Rhizobacter]|uniref:bifunctional tetrahydrofolate synthase/dihydrofolate synthase n=1 Tax=unclassified Rhizobacter TaxID=2640088 RepID=UPI0006FFC2EC|nr:MULTISPECIES: bifunctional tetrahydrofolate synthase/dihydrofolate synthase [unclassified Rhizobacter]KQU80651.1 bifunctional folylpolyglutamate synthase/dihydrofolate synthase [Rhizobacter sp. Root29]KQW09671.1 bifunctional folylpolyglutamate synthase/dihydrofolate synthase [Rhizobacter sp. Root1238]KRB14700.1 bifunctional folylpolyglutamate synthase/dihydrofolate synthase [Rhizobacter sp. Root16D2]
MATPTTLADWLAHCEQLHSKDIDMGLERSLLIKQRLGIDFQVPVITVAGTNGKGSTCAMLESIGLQAGYRVGLYIKPHFVHFEERCRVNGRSVDAAELIPHFQAVEDARAGMPLTYFEFTTMAILRLLASAPLDMVILEVGLGGRLDTVNAIDTDCAVITSIDIDHTAYLGTDRESIGREKAGIMRTGKPVVVGDPMVPASIVARAAEIGADLRLLGRDFNYAGDQQQWGWGGRDKRFNGLAYPALRGANQLLNASAALAAFEALRDRLPITAQAVRNGFASVELTGRFQIVPGQPTLVLDVAHNPHAVGALAENLDQMGFFPRTHVVFGAMADKDLEAIIRRMAPLVDTWHFTDLPIARAATAADLQQLHERLALKGPGPVTTFRHTNPDEALRATIVTADPADRIVVFGSFFTVGGVLKDGIPRLSAKHLS